MDTNTTSEAAGIGTGEWDGVAAAWEQFDRHLEDGKRPVTEALVRGLALREGERVLEIGAGTGHLAAHLATIVGPGGGVVASDISAAMVARCGRNLTGLPQARAQIADASVLEGFAAEFDGVTSRMGLMFVPDPAVAFAAARRVLLPEGRLAAAVWAGPEHNPWMTVVGMSAAGAGLDVTPPFGPGGPFSLGDEAVLHGLAADAGFTDVRVDTVDLTWPFADAADHITTCGSLSPALAPAIDRATDEQLAALHRLVADADAAFAADDGRLVIPGRALVVTGHI